MSFRFIEEKDKEQTKSAKRSLHDKPTIKEVPVSGGGDDDDDVEDDDEEDDGDREEGEELRFSLLWDDATECAVDVELGKANGRVYLLVNGEEVRQQQEVLETAIIDAFRSEMNLEAN